MEPYEIAGEVKRFDGRDGAFTRSRNDPNSPVSQQQPRSAEEAIASGQSGYGREDYALQAGSRVVHGVFRQSHLGQLMSPAADTVRHEPENATQFTERLKAAALFFGAAEVGVTRVNPLWVYAADGEDESPVLADGLDAAVVMTIEMDHDLVATSPAATASAATGMGYSQMAVAVVSLAAYLTALGYSALPSGNDTALSIPLAVDAGLGELGRSGNLITQRHGPRVRICKVFTDAPLTEGQLVSFGVAKTCAACTECIDACPGDAIARGDKTPAGPTPSNNPGVLKWYTDPDKCLAFWRANATNCSNCIASCPYNRRRQ
ncbi:MAG: 4Fe-4S double cluster binding domain-containing protein [Planctomycetota bacterium]|jgi:NAD-dependent dihydropyrimidine dehydrogenase PreA subunit